MLDWRIVATLFSAIIGVYVIVILYYRWVSKHTSDSSIHPSKDALVYEDVCEKVQETNKIEHKHLEDYIEAQEARTEKKFGELKTDMHNGFSDLKQCIRDINKG